MNSKNAIRCGRRAGKGNPRLRALLHSLSVAIFSDGFNRTLFERLLAERDIFRCLGLPMHVRIPAFRVPAEEIGRCLAAQIAIDTLRVGVEPAWNVALMLVLRTGQSQNLPLALTPIINVGRAKTILPPHG